MLDSETKRRLDRLRDILVGKVPDPKSQVDQITTGLIYKFMYDMDTASAEAGGNRRFFKGEFRKYSWEKLFDPKVGGVERVKLYGEAIERMYTHPSAPPLFREIFKNSYLPFRDASTLNMFLTEIGEFHYSHSEKLGDAYEYLLSYMGSQGDAGQFRTPRHIIDFIVEIVDPKKNETILDPACGTAGFLISSYKHIMKDKKKLTALDLRKLSENLVGYDISPDMTRMSLVNMYLHNFPNPKIFEYDTLSSEDRWNEYYDVILANPPFFSPKGGIQPHSRFGVDSKRAEVLFVDYIIQHLKPNGRAGVIVPEGIIFQTGRAYKALRKKLVEDCLVGVISLPAGVFQPYSGVKTSVLILDKDLHKHKDSIFFARVDNDGYSLGAQRSPISQNDIPKIVDCITGDRKSKLFHNVTRNSILSDEAVNISGKTRLKSESTSVFSESVLSKLTKIQNGYAFRGDDYVDNGIRVIRITNVQKGRIIDENPKFHPKLSPEDHEKYSLRKNDILISLTGNVGRVGKLPYLLEPAYLNQRVSKIESTSSSLLSDYLYLLLNSDKFEVDCVNNSSGVAQKNLSTSWIGNYKIPVPPIEIQHEIVHELEGYQKIIDGAKQVVENYRPSIDIELECSESELATFDQVSITDVSTFYRGVTYKKSQEVNQQGIEILRANNVSLDGNLVLNDVKLVSKDVTIRKDQWLKYEDILMCIASGSKDHIGKTAIIEQEVSFAYGGFMGVLRSSEKILPKFLYGILQDVKFNDYLALAISGANINNIKESILSGFRFPLPPMDVQRRMVGQLEDNQETIKRNRRLIEKNSRMIQKRIAKVWGE